MRKSNLILLINPDLPANSPWGPSKLLPPQGLMYIAAALEKGGYNVKIFDNYLFKKPVEHIKLLAEKLSPEMIGINCNSVTYRNCVKIARAVKEAVPESKVVVGGPHPTYLPETLLRHEEVDFAVIGEGETAMVELARRLVDGDGLDLENIPGIAYKRGNEIAENPQLFIENLDSIPLPSRHLVLLHKYDRKMSFLDVAPVDTMNVVRGCPFNCSFCETKKIWGSNPRFLVHVEF